MVETWFGLLGVTVTLFAVLDGWNIGAGVVHWLAGRTESDRREIIAAQGPLWSWHEVWLLAFGGTFLLSFPRIMATSFAGLLSAVVTAAVMLYVPTAAKGGAAAKVTVTAWPAASEAMTCESE